MNTVIRNSFKKIICLLTLVLLVSACSKKVEEHSIRIVSPNGAPSLALVSLMDNENVELDVVEGSDVLQAEFVSGEADIIVAPVNLGVMLANKTGNYSLKAILTWGNLYLVSFSSDLESGTLAAFGENGVPGKVINSLSDELSAYDIEWFADVSEASAAFLSGKYDGAIIAEPFLTNIRGKSENTIHEIASMQDLYKEKNGVSSYPQAALFVKEEVKDDAYLNEVLKTVKEATGLYNSDKQEFIKAVENADLETLGFKNKDLIIAAFERMAIDYKDIDECREDVSLFLTLFNIEWN